MLHYKCMENGGVIMTPTAIKVKPLEDYHLLVTFDNGEEKVYDVNPMIRGDWFGQLRDNIYEETLQMCKHTKIMAMYLPQYHEIAENNEWWGQGFTEWTNVKKARPVYEGHQQPRIPLNGNFYDLSDPNVMQEQMEMAYKYGIDGFCIYHYWFKGKKLLEKPVEQLLSQKEVQLSYCLCWANEPWTRTWDGDNGSKQIIMKQDYGDETDWKEHFFYLNEFFKQEKYIKVDNKPVIVIYKENEIPNCKMMFKLWNEMALQQGFDGIYLINTKRQQTRKFYPNFCDAYYDFEPFSTMNNMLSEELFSCCRMIKKEDGSGEEIRLIDYAMFSEYMIKRYAHNKHYLGSFLGFDNSPRRGNKTNFVFENNSPDVFEKFFREQYIRSIKLENEFMFINAWNEWGEGTFLEPDELYRYGYLEAIRRVIDEFVG